MLIYNIKGESDTIANVVYITFSHIYFYIYYVIPNTNSFKDKDLKQGVRIKQILDILNI